MTVLNAINMTNEERSNFLSQTASDVVIVVYHEDSYYAVVSDPIKSSRKRPYGVKVYRRQKDGRMRIAGNPLFYKTEKNALLRASEIDAQYN